MALATSWTSATKLRQRFISVTVHKQHEHTNTHLLLLLLFKYKQRLLSGWSAYSNFCNSTLADNVQFLDTNSHKSVNFRRTLSVKYWTSKHQFDNYSPASKKTNKWASTYTKMAIGLFRLSLRSLQTWMDVWNFRWTESLVSRAERK